jgi:hypothetical protein
MSYSVTAGLVPAVVAAGISLVVVAWLAGRRGVLSSYHAVGLAAAVFSAAFAVLNVVLQLSVVNRDFLIAEIASGRLALRVTSVVVVVAFAQLLIAMSEDEGLPDPHHYDLHRELDQWFERTKGWSLATATSQATVLMFALATSWSLTITGKASILVALLNWSFAFISDDFFLAVNYRRKLGVPPPAFDRWRIKAGRWLVTVLLIVTTVVEYSGLVASLVVGAVVLFTVVMPVVIWYRQGGRLALETIGTVPEYPMSTGDDLRQVVALARAEIERGIVDARANGLPEHEVSEISGYSVSEIDALVANRRAGEAG